MGFLPSNPSVQVQLNSREKKTSMPNFINPSPAKEFAFPRARPDMSLHQSDKRRRA
jgi:hypothetical protein